MHSSARAGCVSRTFLVTKITSCLTEALMSRDLINLAVAALPEGQDCTIESSLVGFGFSAPVRPEAEQQHCSCTSHPSFSPRSSSYHQQGGIPTQPALKDEIEDGKNPTPLIPCHYSQSLGCFFFFFLQGFILISQISNSFFFSCVARAMLH